MVDITDNNTVSLLDSLTEDHIAARVDAATWEDAVVIAGKLMVYTGLVRESYISAMIETLHDLGPYSVIAPGIAMPHARPEDGVIRTGFSLITLDQPVEFGNQANDPVDILIGFAALNKTSHILALKEIAKYLGDHVFVQCIRASKTKAELTNLIESQRKRL